MKIKLGEILEDLDIKQKKISEALGIPRNTMSNYVTGRTEPDFETLIKIADYLNVSVDSILGRKEKYILISEEELKKLIKARNLLQEVIKNRN
ncbi:MAG: helix-turn-helix transcriptional regulator [Firmicutes bacterium]|uniref:Helix-turn-helix transcriptional regulator n=1 Tax=Candidatus Onthovivens merdipullorum TaxID=2840889 RepID=A0A9D9DIM3_9BACL|nr:helix-turn-helix transcriptional regulator [Candidatus Onthovivens merdipullorum]